MTGPAPVNGFTSVETLEAFLAYPSPALVEDMSRLDGNIMVLGAGGKMGPTLALLAQHAMDESGARRRIIAVSRFSQPGLAERLRSAGIETIACDLMAPGALAALPDVPNLVYMVGVKFGATGQEPRTWAMNSFLPGLVAERFQDSRIVVFSSGNVYPLAPVANGGSTEETPPAPIGEYAQSVLGRERILQFFAKQFDTPAILFRLNYAVEMRYGVLVDIAQKVAHDEPIDISMGHVNVIWQGDANAYALRCLRLAAVPARILNVTGPETLSVRQIAQRFGCLLGKQPLVEGMEQADALLSNAQAAHGLMGYPSVAVDQVIRWTAAWIKAGLPTLNKPTKYQVRTGRF